MTWISTRQAAELLAVSIWTVRRRIAAGELQADWVGGRWRIAYAPLGATA